MDLPLEGDRFTWSNGTASSRLDRFEMFPLSGRGVTWMSDNIACLELSHIISR